MTQRHRRPLRLLALASLLLVRGVEAVAGECDEIKVDVQGPATVPYYLKDMLGSEPTPDVAAGGPGLDFLEAFDLRRLFRGSSEHGLHWFRFHCENQCWLADATVVATLRILGGESGVDDEGGADDDVRAFFLQPTDDRMILSEDGSELDLVFPLDAWKEDVVYFDPPLEVTSIERPVGLELQWEVRLQDSDDVVEGDIRRLTILPQGKFDWGWKASEHEEPDLEFLLASLALWTRDPQCKVFNESLEISSAAALDRKVQGDPTAWARAWMAEAWHRLFSDSGLLGMREPEKCDSDSKRFPCDRVIRTPSGLLGDGAKPDPIEAALLLGALSWHPFAEKQVELRTLVVPSGGRQRVFVGWWVPGRAWSAFELDPALRDFEANLAATRPVVEAFLKANREVEKAIVQDGVHYASKTGALALDLRRAARTYGLRGLGSGYSCRTQGATVRP